MRTTTMLFSVLIGALIFCYFVNGAGLSGELLALVAGLDMLPVVVILAILAIYIVFGMVLESLSMLLTVPIFYTLLQRLGFDLVWFGIVVVVVTKISLITSPVPVLLMILLGGLTAIAPLSTDIYLPAFPAMRAQLELAAGDIRA